MLNPGRVSIGYSNLSHLLTHLFMLLYPTAVLGLEGEFGMSYGELISLSLGGFILFGVGALPGGWLADRWSEVGMLAVLLFGMGVSAILTGLAPTPWMLGGGLALIGLFASIYHPVGIAMIVRHAPRRGRALGLNGVYGGIGLASGALVAGTLTDLISWRAAFIIPGLAAIGVGVAFLVSVRASGLRSTREDAFPQPEVSGQAMVSAFLTLTVTTSCVGLIFQATSIALPKIFAQRLALFETGGAASVGVFVTLVYLVAGAFQVLGGMMADRFPLKWVYLTSYFIQAPVLIVAASLRNWPLVVFACLMVVLQSGAAPAETALFARYSPARWRATALGLKFVIGLGVSAASVPLVALIFETTGGFYWLFVIMGTLAILAATFGLLLPAESGGPPFAAPAVPAAPAAGGD